MEHLKGIILRMLDNNEKNLQTLSTEFDKGHFIGYHNALADLLLELGVDVEESYEPYDEGMFD